MLEPVERLLELEERDTDPLERLLEPLDTEPEERVEPLFTDEDLREPEVVEVLEPALVALLELELLIERELTDLDEPRFAPVACATDLVEAWLTAAVTPSALREPVVAKEPEARAVDVAVPPATVEPPLRP